MTTRLWTRCAARRGIWHGLAGIAAALAATIAVAQAAEPAKPDVVVFAAASLKTALDKLAPAWTAESGGEAKASLAASSQLAKQIEAGAPADVFVSADLKWMDYLDKAGLIDPATRRTLLGNRLVLIAHGRDAKPVAIGKDLDLAGTLGGGKLAMAFVDSVPAGIYGKAALTALGQWDTVSASVVQADNVRAALTLVARGEAPFGIVYATDAAAADNVSVVGVFPADSHEPIVYPIAVTRSAKSPAAAQRYIDFLASPKGREVFTALGFAVLAPEPVAGR
ncbi:MAG: molybdate ABC transporter substrate-binding protein [Hyphomicrobiaceae bacterium]|nr:molybdate ABC transporter substrate-binding protein [Hyphomicrobiaceae bacterium]